MVIPCTVPTGIYVIDVKGLKMHNAVRLTKHCQHDASYTHGPAMDGQLIRDGNQPRGEQKLDRGVPRTVTNQFILS